MTELAQAVVNGLQMGFLYALVAVGLTIIWGLMEMINFAHGDERVEESHLEAVDDGLRELGHGPDRAQFVGFGLLSRSCQLGFGYSALKLALLAMSHGHSVCFSPSQPIWVTTPVASTFCPFSNCTPL